MEENIKNCKKLKNYWKEESDSTRDDTIFIDSSDNELSDKKDTNIINENITNDDGYFKKPFSPSTCHVSTTEINNDVTRERASSFTRSGTHRLRDSRRRLAMRQRRLNSGSTKNHSIKDSHPKEFSRLQAHLQSIPHLMKSSPAIQRLSSSVSSLIENGYNNISTSLPKKRRNTNENKKDSSILTTYPISPYHRSNMVRNSVRKETIVKKETSSETTLPEQNVVGNNQKNEKLMGKIFNEDDINYSLQDKAYNSCGIEEEDNPNEGIKNIFKGLGGAMKTSSLVNIQSNTEEKYNIQELSTDIKIAVRVS
uniref:BHLH domain-containing protein n=1 Tax=Parastrongyloides trichosuri TaxID=131310 RepID=A0A0N4ZEA0_PARTI